MIVSLQADRSRVADLADDLDARTRFSDTEAFAREDLLVAQRVELREALAEFKFVTVDAQAPVGAL